MNTENNNPKNNNINNNINNNSLNNAVIICNKCNNVIQLENQSENQIENKNIICNNCGNVITNLKKFDIKELENKTKEEIQKDTKEKIQNNEKNQLIEIDSENITNFFYISNIVISQNLKEIILINFLFSLNTFNVILFLIIGGYLTFWVYKYITIGAFLNQLIFFILILLILGSVLYILALLYNAILYKFSEKIFTILTKNNITKNKIKLINKPLINFNIINFANFKNLLSTGFKISYLSFRINLKYFLVYLLITILFFLIIQNLIKISIGNYDYFIWGFCGVLIIIYLFFFVMLLFLVYNNLLKILTIVFYTKNIINKKDTDFKELSNFLNTFLRKKRVKLLFSVFIFSMIYYLIIPILQVLLILTGIGLLFISLPIILLDMYFISFVSILVFLEDKA